MNSFRFFIVILLVSFSNSYASLHGPYLAFSNKTDSIVNITIEFSNNDSLKLTMNRNEYLEKRLAPMSSHPSNTLFLYAPDLRNFKEISNIYKNVLFFSDSLEIFNKKEWDVNTIRNFITNEINSITIKTKTESIVFNKKNELVSLFNYLNQSNWWASTIRFKITNRNLRKWKKIKNDKM